jgi:hypothetical protein
MKSPGDQTGLSGLGSFDEADSPCGGKMATWLDGELLESDWENGEAYHLALEFLFRKETLDLILRKRLGSKFMEGHF